ncbi:aspartyl protease family protein [Mucilaginibacter myungsuensis]|uniref:Aspartyl protease family protein n=1 Tax=Mucilaginibacter myungsuensis TaxID=649104 RepID=A0A929KVQ2_9SPHI|nr:aspartyl protease family protein [Mucilaginibacter myungsuensis]MBE9661330.1 aspartyl protease family protein [Mucilaginibacter myungsuensis]MDN3597473.1 aspartyl protease family protein [Mucilaginibacter myungsuensis]
MKYFLLSISTLIGATAFAQTKLSVIRATSKSVAINDGGYLDKEAWTLSPGARSDVYTAERTRQTKWVTFYTNIDSIRIKVKPGSKTDFVILLNGKDSCFTRVISAIPEREQVSLTKADTIPFTLMANNAIAVKGIIDGKDTINLHFDASSFDFHLTKDAILNKTHLLADKTTPNYNRLNKAVTLTTGTITRNNPPLLATGLTAHGMDGRLGWNLFEGKTLNLNYDTGLMIISARPPKNVKGYTKVKMGFARSYPYISGEFVINGKKYKGNFLMDTGSDQAVFLDGGWAKRTGFPTDSLKLIRTTSVSDPRGVKYESKMVSAHSFVLAGSTFANVPTLVMGTKNPLDIEMNYLGNDLLKRFHLIFDFKNDYLYLKPNRLMEERFKENS